MFFRFFFEKKYIQLFFKGILDLLHIYNILKENFWAVVNPIFFAFIGFIFNVHEQETELRTLAHIMSSGNYFIE